MKSKAVLNLLVNAVAFAATVCVSAQEQIPVPSYADGECWVNRVVSKNYLGYTSNSLPDGDAQL